MGYGTTVAGRQLHDSVRGGARQAPCLWSGSFDTVGLPAGYRVPLDRIGNDRPARGRVARERSECVVRGISRFWRAFDSRPSTLDCSHSAVHASGHPFPPIRALVPTGPRPTPQPARMAMGSSRTASRIHTRFIPLRLCARILSPLVFSLTT